MSSHHTKQNKQYADNQKRISSVKYHPWMTELRKIAGEALFVTKLNASNVKCIY